MSVFEYFTALNTCIIVAVAIIASIISYKRKYGYWSSQGVSGPTPVPFLGSTHEFYVDSIPNLLVKNAKIYGRIYGQYDFFGAGLIVSDPKLVKQICVKDFHLFTNRREMNMISGIFGDMLFGARDKKWKRLRNLISPTFSTGKIKRMKPLIEECVRNGLEYLEVIAAKKEPLNVKQFWSRFTLEVIARCCFATEINSHKDPNNEFFRQVTSFFEPPGLFKILSFVLFFAMPQFIMKYFPVKFMREETIEYISEVTLQLLKQRKESKSDYNDFLQLLTNANDENNEKIEVTLTESEIVANCFLFFVSGYETTANLLNYATYSLALNPDIQEKLYDEVKAHFPEENIDYEIANKLPYLDAVVSETLRMYPSVINTERESSADVELENTGITLPASTPVQIAVYAIHHDPEYYPDPDTFNPGRFMDENRETIDPYTFIPFGAGPRNCVAMRFALIEAKLAIISTVLKFKFEKSNKTILKPKFRKFTNVLMCGDIIVNVIKR